MTLSRLSLSLVSLYYVTGVVGEREVWSENVGCDVDLYCMLMMIMVKTSEEDSGYCKKSKVVRGKKQLQEVESL